MTAPDNAQAEAEPAALPDPDPEVGSWPGWSDRSMLAPDLEPEPDAEAEAEWADEWDSADSSAYMDRVEAGLEPEAEP